ncbi:hypothetical protein U3516DRAFT_668530 [Neocallimastix sp. 'constans']
MDRKNDKNNSLSKWDSSQVIRKRPNSSMKSLESLMIPIDTANIYKKEITSFDIIDRLWKKINKKRKKRRLNDKNRNIYNDDESRKRVRDTTVEFLQNNNVSGYNEINKDMYYFRSNTLNNDLSSNTMDEGFSNRYNINKLDGGYSNSKKILDGLTFNDIYDENISKSLIKISDIFVENKDDIEDLISMQIAFNRSWKLFLIGLFQNESINRFFSMKAINYSVKHVNDTLLDIETLKGLIFTLNNISVSDESKVNRTRAIYLLGEFAKYFNQMRTNEDLSLYVNY